MYTAYIYTTHYATVFRKAGLTKRGALKNAERVATLTTSTDRCFAGAELTAIQIYKAPTPYAPIDKCQLVLTVNY
jgi:hypothetical protein